MTEQTTEKHYSLQTKTCHALVVSFCTLLFYFIASLILQCHNHRAQREFIEYRHQLQEALQEQRIREQELATLRRTQNRELELRNKELERELAVKRRRCRK